MEQEVSHIFQLHTVVVEWMGPSTCCYDHVFRLETIYL
jgi:hypothetical protein